jgi:diguanylate cyclase (GGDEF)-like protein
MPVDPEVQARVARLTGVDPASLPPSAERIASTARAFAALGIESPAVRAAPVAIWSTGADGVVLSWNDMAHRLFGWVADDVIGLPAPWTPDATGEQVVSHRDGHALRILLSSSPTGPEPVSATVWFATDVTGERAAAHALELEHDRWLHVLPAVAGTVIIVDERCLIREITADTLTVLGHPSESFVGTTGFALLDPAEIERAALQWERVLSDPGHEYRDVFRSRHAEGHYEQVEYTAMNLVADPVIKGIVMTARLVTAQKESDSIVAGEAEVLDLVARGAPLDDTLAAVARIVEHHTGGSAGVLLLRRDAREFEIGTAGSVPVALLELLRRAPLTPSLTFETIDFRRVTVIGDLGSDRRTAHLAQATEALGARSAWSIPIIENRTDELLGLIAVFHGDHRPPSTRERRVSETAAQLAAIAIERHRWQDQLWHQARHDELTGLPNRPSILERLDLALAALAARDADGPDADRQVVVVFVDIDRFKGVNDSCGHAGGDRLLARFAVRLRNLVGPGDFVGRFGADEFIIILERATGLADARFVANRIDLALSEPFSLEEGELYLTASIGVALSTGAESAVDLVQHADAAMARAKELGRDRMEVFDLVMRTQADEQLRTDRQLRAAVERGELTLYYQPVFHVRTGAILGAEALMRWNHPTDGLLLPARFLPVAEDTGTIVRIGRWVLDEAVRQARDWIDRFPHLEPFTVSVNLSPRQISSPGLVEHVARTLERHAWPADQLVLELTEGVLIEDRDASLAVLRDLKALGAGLAIDDFGTGFSSLNELHRFPLDAVKIDPSFVASLQADGSGSPVATAVLHMAHALGLLVVAEGVESAGQHEGLQALQCDNAQGFHLARPAPPDELEDLWRAAARPPGSEP